MAVLPELTSVFTDTGENMNLKPNARREDAEKWNSAPRWIRWLHIYWVTETRLRLACRAGVRKSPFDYAIYTRNSPGRRITFRAAHPTTFWKGRLTMALPPTSSEHLRKFLRS
jgi:hypothetical protein